MENPSNPLVLTDPRHRPKVRRNAFDRLALRLIHDERDLPFIHLMASMGLVLVPCAIYLLTPGTFRWWLAPMYLALLFGVYFDRYILMLHNTSHRTLFKRQYRWMNQIIPWALGPFVGQSPETYFSHHIGMHHPEANLEDDLSSTMHYQRDSLTSFLAYWLRFLFLGMFELTRYHYRRGRLKLMRWALLGELSYFAVVGLLLWFNWPAALTVFVIPFVAARLGMMTGNWSQHAFIDCEDPGNDYKNSIVCVNSRYNRRCFNDGYHIGHHVKPNRHWTDMPADFDANRARYAAENAVVFQGTDYPMIWALLMFKRYDALARRFVDLRESPRSHEEIVALLRQRTQRLPRA